MNIISLEYTLKYRSLDIYISGCKTKCDGCHNPESWNFNQGDEYNQSILDKIEEYVNLSGSLIKDIMIFGGEPLDNNHDELFKLLSDIKQFNKEIWLFTSKEINEVPDNIKELCTYIKTGKYNKNLRCESNEQFGINLATSNQKIYKI